MEPKLRTRSSRYVASVSCSARSARETDRLVFCSGADVDAIGLMRGSLSQGEGGVMTCLPCVDRYTVGMIDQTPTIDRWEKDSVAE